MPETNMPETNQTGDEVAIDPQSEAPLGDGSPIEVDSSPVDGDGPPEDDELSFNDDDAEGLGVEFVDEDGDGLEDLPEEEVTP